MILFLTSDTFRDRADRTDKIEMISDNGLIDEMRNHFPCPCRALYFCLDLDGELVRDGFEYAGVRFESFICLNSGNARQARELIGEANFIILGGGHTPTQNRFFADIALRELLKDYDGVVWGISAGSMNCADIVYAPPEDNGEAVDPEYKRFLTGLGLTKTAILPHYHYWKDRSLDGLKVIDDIILPDSMGRTFCFIADGSYILVKDGVGELRGEAYVIRDGAIEQISSDGDTVML